MQSFLFISLFKNTKQIITLLVIIINLFVFFLITLILFFVSSIFIIIFYHFSIHKIKGLKLLLLLLQLQFIFIFYGSYISSLLISVLFLVIFKQGYKLWFKHTIKCRRFFLLQLPISLFKNSFHIFYTENTYTEREIAFTCIIDFLSETHIVLKSSIQNPAQLRALS